MEVTVSAVRLPRSMQGLQGGLDSLGPIAQAIVLLSHGEGQSAVTAQPTTAFCLESLHGSARPYNVYGQIQMVAAYLQHCMDVSVSQVNMYLGLCAAVHPTGWVLLTAAVHQGGGGAFPVEAYSSHLLVAAAVCMICGCCIRQRMRQPSCTEKHPRY